MIKNKIYTLICALAILVTFSAKTYAASTLPVKEVKKGTVVTSATAEDLNEENDIIKRVSMRNLFKKSPEAEINAFFRKHNHYSMTNNLTKLKELYSDSYVNNDGFDKDTTFKMMEMSSDSYKNVKYTTTIDEISANENYAVVKLHEVAQGETTKAIEGMNGTGVISSDIEYVNYLVKENNQWKLSVSNILTENVSLKYGEAKYLDAQIVAPETIPANTDYEVSVKTVLPGGSFIVGSIVNEDIVYPQKNTKDSFKAIKNDSLARILKSNNNNHNEYTTVSVAITRAKIEPPAMSIDMTGIAFFMKRINVISKQANVGK